MEGLRGAIRDAVDQTLGPGMSNERQKIRSPRWQLGRRSLLAIFQFHFGIADSDRFAGQLWGLVGADTKTTAPAESSADMEPSAIGAVYKRQPHCENKVRLSRSNKSTGGFAYVP
jgi:hypothetical protein